MACSATTINAARNNVGNNVTTLLADVIGTPIDRFYHHLNQIKYDWENFDGNQQQIQSKISIAEHLGEKTAKIKDHLNGQSEVVIMMGDLFYEEELAKRALGWIGDLQKCSAISHIFIGDPGRYFLPAGKLFLMDTYVLPKSMQRENHGLTTTHVWEAFNLT